MKAHPYIAWSIIAAILTAVLVYVLHRYLALDLLALLLAALNLITFLVYKYDKLASTHRGAARVPNLVLVAMAVCGGSVGALLGIYFGKEGHKTGPRYRLLRLFVWLSLVFQIGLLSYYFLRSTG